MNSGRIVLYVNNTEHLSEADPWTIDYDVTLAEEEEEGTAADAQQQQQPPSSEALKKEEDGGEDEEDQLKWKGRKVFDVRVDAPAGGGLLVRVWQCVFDGCHRRLIA